MNQFSFGKIAIALILSAGLSAYAQNKKSAEKKDEVKTETHKVLGGLKWTGYGVGKSHTGDLKLKSGTITTKGDEVIGGEFIFDMTTISEANKRLESHLKSADFFDVTTPGFETSQFVIKKVESLKPTKAGDPTHKISGDLTIKGKTNPIEFSTVISKQDKKWKAVGDAEIKDRTKFDIRYNSKQFEKVSKLADKAIEDNISIKIDVITE